MNAAEKFFYEYPILSAIIAIVLVVAVLFVFKAESCKQKSISFEDHRYGLLSGCMVKHNGKWLPLKNIRGFGDEE